jgi:oligopeptide transport system permease protein
MNVAASTSIPAPVTVSEAPWRAALRRLSQDPLAVGGFIFLVLLALFCVFGPMLSPYSQSAQELANHNRPTSAAHWMGTDALGRDVATRVMMGGRVSLLVGIVATAVASVIGVLYGLIAGLAGGRTDAFMMRVVDILYAFPFMNFIILITALLSKHPALVALDNSMRETFAKIPWLGKATDDIGFNVSFLVIFVAIGAVEWLTMSRVVRGQVLALKNQEFVTAARSYGAGRGTILFRHLLPNVMGTVIVYGSLTVPGVMLLEAALSFLGLGIQPPAASWGVLISDGAQQIDTATWLLVFPGTFFFLTLLALNFLGDGLRDVFDPKSVK